MVSKEEIYESLNNVIIKKNLEMDNKCTITLTVIRNSIDGIVKNITTNKYEYDLLMKYIPKFYQQHYNKKEESVFALDFYETEYYNDGTINNVHLPDEAKKMGSDIGLMIDMHNHPSGCCFQSSQDFYTTGLYNEKYAITVAKDGVMIVRYNSPPDLNYKEHATKMGYGATKGLSPILDNVENSKEYQKIIHDYFYENKITAEEMEQKTAKLVADAVQKNRDKLIKNVIKDIASYGYDVEIEYAPVEK